ncbi:MAG: hypothetical protein A3G95_00245 [Flavobacteria bacterium RIFCSPLOWO2_12_FULL_31_7]|nr:MAG: hypothetical protein A3G95_00245 [Flavobacteria bacterium RIFCSPLOWO2_12_FULL_31_7]
MNNKSLIERFITIIENDIDKSSIECNGKDFTFKVNDSSSKEDILLFLNDLFVNVEDLLANKISLNLEKVKIENAFFFFDFKSFQSGYLSYKNVFDDSDIVILKTNNKLEIKYKNEENILLQNYNIYRKTIDYLNGNPLFASIPTTTNEFLLITKEFGFIHIGYNLHEDRTKDFETLKQDFERLKLLFEKKEFIQFFKENIGNIGIHQHDIKDRFYYFLKNLNSLLNLSEKDLDNYILEFSFEKIKSKFKDERNKYFEGLEKNIELISKQVVSFPLTFAATAFASYQVKDKSLILFLIFIAYLLYTIIAFRILKITSYNIECLEFDIEKEEESIKNNYSKVYEEFKTDFDKINRKTKKIKDLLLYLKAILLSMLFLFFGYVIYQIVFFKADKQKEMISIPIDKVNFIQVDSVNNNYNNLNVKSIRLTNHNTKDSVNNPSEEIKIGSNKNIKTNKLPLKK